MRRLFELANAAAPTPRRPVIPTVESPADKYARVAAAMRENHTKEVPPMTESTVPLATLSVETSIDVDVLAMRLGGDVRHDQSGLRCITSEVARSFLDAHHEAQRIVREAAEAAYARLASQPNTARQRVRALVAAQEQFGEFVGAADGPVSAGQALAHMREIDGSRDRQLDHAAAARDELLTGAIRYHSISERR